MDDSCRWPGASGRNYKYYIYPLNYSASANQYGNYIYTKVVSGKWVPLYIGEGDLSAEISKSSRLYACIKRKGATHVHMHVNMDRFDRTQEQTDLLKKYTGAYAPQGCNPR